MLHDRLYYYYDTRLFVYTVDGLCTCYKSDVDLEFLELFILEI